MTVNTSIMDQCVLNDMKLYITLFCKVNWSHMQDWLHMRDLNVADVLFMFNG